MMYYPINLSLRNKQVVIVGGGKVAQRKIEKLLNTGAEVTIISPEITNSLQQIVNEQKLTWKQKQFTNEDIKDAFLVIAATNCKDVNRQVYEATAKHQLINVVDDPSKSNFIVPATLSRGQLNISVSTGGASPSLAKNIVADLAHKYDETFVEYLEFLADCRLEIRAKVSDPNVRENLLQMLLAPQFFELTKKQLYKERQQLFLELLKQKK